MNNKYISEVYENHKISSNFLGIIKYKNLIIITIYSFIILKFLEVLKLSIIYKSYIFIFLFIPILVGSIININGDNILDTIKILIKFYISKKIYISDYNNVIIFLKNNINKKEKIL